MTLTADERAELEAVMRKRHGNAALARRARCVLLWADGERRVDIRTRLACNDAFVPRWTKAFEFQGWQVWCRCTRAARPSNRSPGLKREC